MSKTRFTHLIGNRADQPAATGVIAGTLFYVIDESVLERSNGTAWQAYSGSGGLINIDTGTTGQLPYSRLDGTPSPVVSGNPTLQYTSVTGTQNNFNLSAKLTCLLCSNASALVITGFTVLSAAPSSGDVVIIENIGSSTVRVASQDTGSTDVNRLIYSCVRGQILGIGGSITLIYDGTSSRWRIFHVNPGIPIPVLFDAADYTNLTVESGDVGGYNYQQNGNSVKLANIVGPATTTVLIGIIIIKLPNGFTGQSGVTQVESFARAFNGTWRPAITVISSNDTEWWIAMADGSTFPIVTDGIYWQGSSTVVVN